MSTTKLLAITAGVVIAIMAATAGVAGAVYLGLRNTSAGAAARTVIAAPLIAAVPAARGADVTVQAGAPQGAAMPTYIGPEGFEPGLPPMAQGLSGDGITTWGVAFRETTDASAQPDSALVKSAFADAQKKAQALAEAAGLKLGAIAALTDYTQAQPYYKPCVVPGAPAPAIPPKQGAGTSANSGAPTIVQPLPACNPTRYLVAWVMVRYQLG